jgi:hypothetical protein
MKESDIKIERSDNTVTISKMVSFVGSELNQMEDGESLTLDFEMTLDVEELERIIGKNDATKPGWPKRMVETVVTEGLKTAIKIGVSSLFGP